MFDLVWWIVGSSSFSAENIPFYEYGIVRISYFFCRKCNHRYNYFADFSPSYLAIYENVRRTPRDGSLMIIPGKREMAFPRKYHWDS